MFLVVKYCAMIWDGIGCKIRVSWTSIVQAAVDTLPVSIDNITIVNREQVDAYCNGFSDGEQALANHPGVRSHVSSSMVLPHDSTGFSNTIKIMPNGSEIGHPHIINQTHTASPTTSITQREHLGCNTAVLHFAVSCDSALDFVAIE